VIDLSGIVTSPIFAEPFSIYRTTGGFDEGGWQKTPVGALLTATIDEEHKGVGYSVNDVLTIVQTGGSGATVKVLTVDSGAVETMEIITAGSGYQPNASLSTSVTPSGGTGAKVGITVTPANPQGIPAYGTVTVLNDKELSIVPEGDRIKGAMAFYATTPMYLTGSEGANISDQILWKGEMYKIVNIAPWASFGFNRAVGVRMSGD
jgi:hypothetical protein